MRMMNLRLVVAGCLLGAFLSSLACLVVKSTLKARASGPRLSTLGKSRAVTEQRQHTHEPHVYTAAGSPSHRGSPWSASHFEQFFDQMSQDKADPAPLRVHDLFEGEDEYKAGNGEFGSYSEFSSLLRYIWHAQHPRDCSSARLLILTSHWKQGPGSALHMRVCVSDVCVCVCVSLSLSLALFSISRSLSLARALALSLSRSLSLSPSLSLYVCL